MLKVMAAKLRCFNKFHPNPPKNRDNFQHRLACESLADFEYKMGLGDPHGGNTVFEIVGDWCFTFRKSFCPQSGNYMGEY